MPITSVNTSAGNLSTFASVSKFFHNATEGACLKLGLDKFKRLSDGAVFTGIDENLPCVQVDDSAGAGLTFAPGQTFGPYQDGGWFRHYVDGNCAKMEGDAYIRLSDGAVFTGTDPNMEIVPKAEGDVTGNIDA